METVDLTDHFLIAMPSLDDPNFFRTVTYICTHTEEGAMGIIINRPMDVKLGEIFEHMDIEASDKNATAVRVFEGGPVQRERGFVIHKPVGTWDSMLPISSHLGITTSRDIITAIANGNGPTDFLIALGYAGWSAGQLEYEMGENAWLSTPADMQIIFHTPHDKRWEAAAKKMGVNLTLISSDVGHC
jgi:putative transcriptional regulator